MNWDLLRRAHLRAHSPLASVTHPSPLIRPHVIFDTTAAAADVAASTRVVRLRNVGDEDCVLHGVTSIPGVSIEGVREVGLLRARSRDWSSLAVSFYAFDLQAFEGEAPLEVTVKSLGGGELTFTTTVHYELRDGTGASIVPAVREMVLEMMLRDLHLFSVVAPGVEQATLRVEDGPTGRGQYPMVKTRHDTFEVAVPLDDGGRYAYRFDLDGAIRPDDRIPQQDHVNGVGVCSALVYDRGHRGVLEVRNALSQEITLAVESSQRWLTVGSERLKLAPSATGHIDVVVKPHHLTVGEHRAAITLKPSKTPNPVSVAVRATLRAPGPVPALPKESVDLGTVFFGAPLAATIPLQNIGTGTLKGRVVSEDPAISGPPFEIAGSETANVAVNVLWQGAPPSAAKEYAAKVTLETNSLVFDLRELRVAVRYRLIPMRLTPASVSDDRVTIGATKEIMVKAFSGSGARLTDVQPVTDGLPAWLEVEPKGEGDILVRLRADRWPGPPSQKQSAEVTVVDRPTGLRGTLAVTCSCIEPRLTVGPTLLQFGDVSQGRIESQTVQVGNTGPGDLLVKEIVLDHDWMSATVTDAHGSPTARIDLRVDSRKMTPGKHRGLMQIVTNDLQRQTVDVPVRVRVTG